MPVIGYLKIRGSKTERQSPDWSAGSTTRIHQIYQDWKKWPGRWYGLLALRRRNGQRSSIRDPKTTLSSMPPPSFRVRDWVIHQVIPCLGRTIADPMDQMSEY